MNPSIGTLPLGHFIIIIIIIIIFSYFVRDFPTGNVAFLLGTLNETLCDNNNNNNNNNKISLASRETNTLQGDGVTTGYSVNY